MKTAECVSPKHPDKMCDQISDAILDACLVNNPKARVAIEVMGGHGKVYITGEISHSSAILETNDIVHRITGGNEEVIINVVKQSPEISNGVDTGGAGDQGIMVGYACNDNEEMIPQELYLARELCKYIYEKYPYDGKTQITLDDEGKIHTIVVSFQNTTEHELSDRVANWLRKLTEKDVNYPNGWALELKGGTHLNPAGDWNQGGFEADTGLTGRKLIVDNYGPQITIGGGAFSGKDPSKVDRSGAYMARKIAVGLLKVNNDKFKEVTVKLAYAIGVAEPVMATFEATGKDGYKTSGDIIHGKEWNLKPKGIIDTLKLKEPQYEETSRWGHFGNGFTWDK